MKIVQKRIYQVATDNHEVTLAGKRLSNVYNYRWPLLWQDYYSMTVHQIINSILCQNVMINRFIF